MNASYLSEYMLVRCDMQQAISWASKQIRPIAIINLIALGEQELNVL